MNLEDKLNQKYKNIIEIIKKEAIKQNLNLFIVGGVVRDLILDYPIKDIDFLIEGSAIDFVQNAGFKIKSIHKDFNTAKIIIENEEFDVASTRIENYPKKGGLPNVIQTGVDIKEDLKRRDFTINSIAYDIRKNEIIDIFNGTDDIKKGILRVLHKCSFIDDPTRILRGLDFKYRFDFDFDFETKKLIKECIQNFDNKDLSIDRIYLTLNKIFSFPYSNKILEDIIEDKIYKIWTKNVYLKKEEINSLDETIKIFDIKEKNKFYISALEAVMFVKAPLNNDFEIYDFYKKMNDVQIGLYYFKTKDKTALKYLELKNIKTFIKGDDLIQMGFVQGPFIGIILADILKEKILYPDKFKTKEDEINFVFSRYET